MKKSLSLSFMLLSILFCVCLITANLLEIKVIKIGSLPLSVTAGMLVFPISYIINDCIAEVWGFRKARLIIWIGFLANFFVIAMSQLAVMLPAAEYWDGEVHFNFVFGMAPRIVVASLIAFLTGSFFNAYVMSRMKIVSNGKHFSLRAIVSTLVGESVDSVIFFPIAFGGVIPFDEMLKLMAVQIVLKTAYEIVILPVTIKVVNYIKRIDECDAFDVNVSYKFWRIGDL
ncbi:MAG: queuosine precursor transporter [Bacteroidaceae bacterium]|nr:queuosine precursor transporter [Bacteroidaceae bacterium]